MTIPVHLQEVLNLGYVEHLFPMLADELQLGNYFSTWKRENYWCAGGVLHSYCICQQL